MDREETDQVLASLGEVHALLASSNLRALEVHAGILETGALASMEAIQHVGVIRS